MVVATEIDLTFYSLGSLPSFNQYYPHFVTGFEHRFILPLPVVPSMRELVFDCDWMPVSDWAIDRNLVREDRCCSSLRL